MKSFVGYIANKIVKAIPRKKKVSPDIKSVKRFTEKILKTIDCPQSIL